MDNTSENAPTILLVDDEARVRTIACRILRSHGYQVVEAGDGPSALEVASKQPNGIDLLITDVDMPTMLGSELAERMATQHPRVQVVFMSAYGEEAALHLCGPRISFLAKPFLASQLVAETERGLARARTSEHSESQS